MVQTINTTNRPAGASPSRDVPPVALKYRRRYRDLMKAATTSGPEVSGVLAALAKAHAAAFIDFDAASPLADSQSVYFDPARIGEVNALDAAEQEALDALASEPMQSMADVRFKAAYLLKFNEHGQFDDIDTLLASMTESGKDDEAEALTSSDREQPPIPDMTDWSIDDFELAFDGVRHVNEATVWLQNQPRAMADDSGKYFLGANFIVDLGEEWCGAVLEAITSHLETVRFSSADEEDRRVRLLLVYHASFGSSGVELRTLMDMLEQWKRPIAA